MVSVVSYGSTVVSATAGAPKIDPKLGDYQGWIFCAVMCFVSMVGPYHLNIFLWVLCVCVCSI